MDLEKDAFQLLVGIDWAEDDYKVVAVDLQGEAVWEVTVEHAGAAIGRFIEQLIDRAQGEAHVAVAIETPRGAMVETLIERGVAVFAINPKQLDRFRDRHTPAGAKDDRLDSYVLADSLRTDMKLFRRLCLDDPRVVELREFSRAHEELGQELRRLANRLRDQLHRYFPELLSLCPAADEAWFWQLLRVAPTPQAARRLKAGRISRLLAAAQIRRLTAEDVLRALQGPCLSVAPGVVEAASAHVELILPRLQLVHGQRHSCQRRLDELLKQVGSAESPERKHRDAEILQSLPGAGRVVVAAMLTEASQPLAARDYQALRAHSGVAPVTHQSGKRTARKKADGTRGRPPRVLMRRSCNARLRNAVYHMARVAAEYDSALHARYAGLRARGQSHGRALRGLADHLLRVLIGMLKSDTLYSAQRPLLDAA